MIPPAHLLGRVSRRDGASKTASTVISRHSHSHSQPPSLAAILHLPKSNIYQFGAWNSRSTPPVFRDVEEWRIEDGEAWAIVAAGSRAKSALFRTLLGHLRVSPHPSPQLAGPSLGLYPFLYPRDPYPHLGFVSFTHRSRSDGASSGAFVDFGARYGALRDENRITLRQSMFPEMIPDEIWFKEDAVRERRKVASNNKRDVVDEEGLRGDAGDMVEKRKAKRFKELVQKLDLGSLLDIPKIGLSNGQTRRARILKALLADPRVLLLDEPLTGLDAQTRPKLTAFLHELHSKNSPHIILGLRSQDSVPDWITHLAWVNGDEIKTGRKGDVKEVVERFHSEKEKEKGLEKEKNHYTSAGRDFQHKNQLARNPAFPVVEKGTVLVDLRDATIQYGDRTVLNNITWLICAGDRWHLQGTNGSGKTTLLSLLTGIHPRSFSLQNLSLLSPLRPRRQIPTPVLSSQISLFSPELFDSFPRRYRHVTTSNAPSSRPGGDPWSFSLDAEHHEKHGGGRVWDVIGTGFDGVFVESGKYNVGRGIGMSGSPDLTEEERLWRVRRIRTVLNNLGPESWVKEDSEIPSSNSIGSTSGQRFTRANADFAQEQFAGLSIAEQRIVLLMRAIVSRAPVVILDEVWSGMEEGMLNAAGRYLKLMSKEGEGAFTEDQAVIVVTHWQDEVPWSVGEGLRVFKLEKGAGKEFGRAMP